MDDPNLNRLLQWSIANSVPSTGPTGVRAVPDGSSQPSDTTTATAPNSTTAPDPSSGQSENVDPSRGPRLDEAMLKALMGGPSDPELMKAAIEVIQDPAVELDQKEIAFENLETLVQQIDNANNMDVLGLWPPLLAELDDKEELLRGLAALCVSTIVQNNDTAQKKLMELDGIPKLVKLATSDPNLRVRKRAILALSSAVRNYQEALDLMISLLPDRYKPQPSDETREKKKVDAGDMEQVDEIIHRMRAEVVAALQG